MLLMKIGLICFKKKFLLDGFNLVSVLLVSICCNAGLLVVVHNNGP